MSLQSSAQFRRGGQRDDRRRRLFSEEPCGMLGSQGSRSAYPDSSLLSARKSENYGDAAFMDEIPRLTDLIPRRLTTIGLLLLVGPRGQRWEPTASTWAV